MAMADRTANTVWEGDLAHGQRHAELKSGATPELPGHVGFAHRSAPTARRARRSSSRPRTRRASRWRSRTSLSEAGNEPERLEVTSTVTLDLVDGAPTVTTSKLTVRGKVPGHRPGGVRGRRGRTPARTARSRGRWAASTSRSTRQLEELDAARLGRGGGSAQFEFEPSPSSSTARNASCGTSMRPTCFMRFLPSFWRSSSLRLREMSPP